MTPWHLNTFDYLKNQRNFHSEIKNIFLVSQMLSFRHNKQTSRNIADTTFKGKIVELKKMKLICGSSLRKKNKPPPLIHQFSSRIPKIVQPSPVNYFFKNLSSHPLKKEGEGTTNKAWCCTFCAYWYMYIYIYYELM